MTNEKKIVLDKINESIHKRKTELLKKLPYVHTIDDGFIFRFFSNWDNCNENELIKYKIIKNIDNQGEINIFYYVPKGAYFELKKRDHIKGVSCLEGKLEINYNNSVRIVESGTKINIDTDFFEGRAIENCYLFTVNK